MDGLYCFTGSSGYSCSAFSNFVNQFTLWHNRFGHPSNIVLSVLKHLLKLSKIDDLSSCETCHEAKHSHEPFPFSQHKTCAFFDLIHADVRDPYRVESYDGNKCFLTFVDDFSRATWVFFMKSKIKVMDLIE